MIASDLSDLRSDIVGRQLQHYVPQFYLEGFQNPDRPNCVWVYEKGVAEPKLQPIPVTAAEMGFYTPDQLQPGQSKDGIEREILTRIESNAAYIIKRWRTDANFNVTEAEHERISLFVSCLHARSRMFRRDVLELLTVTAKEESSVGAEDEVFLDSYLKSNPGMSKDEMRDALRSVNEPGAVSIRPTQSFVLGMTLAMIDTSLHFFLDRRWSFMKAPRDSEFITSDSPVSVFTLTHDGTALFNLGVGLRDSVLTLPLTPTLALCMTNGGTLASRRVSAQRVDEANRRSACQSERFVYASRKSKRIAELVNRFASTRDEPRIDPAVIRTVVRNRRLKYQRMLDVIYREVRNSE
jgi:hypothetical protein